MTIPVITQRLAAIAWPWEWVGGRLECFFCSHPKADHDRHTDPDSHCDGCLWLDTQLLAAGQDWGDSREAQPSSQTLREAAEDAIRFLRNVEWSDHSSEYQAGDIRQALEAALAAQEASPQPDLAREAFRAGFLAHPAPEAEVFTWSFDPGEWSLAADREESAWQAYLSACRQEQP
jgi:hypothetical protein